MLPPRSVAAAALLAAVLAGCRIDAATEAVPEGYHRMPDGTLMADIDPDAEVVLRDVGGNGVQVPTHTRPDGTISLGPPGAGHNHPAYDYSFLPDGITPVGIKLPRIALDARVLEADMDSSGIQGPAEAGDLAWLHQTRRPGEVGPAVIGGVRQLGDEPGALAHVDQLRPGDQFLVTGADGEALPFEVDRVRPVPVTQRQDAVFAAGQHRPELRLVAWWTGAPDAAEAADWVVDAHQLIEDG